MEQNNMNAILTENQVDILRKDIVNDLTVKITELYKTEIIKLTNECNEFVENGLTPYKQLIVLHNQLSKYNDQYNEVFENIKDNVLSQWGHCITIPNEIKIEEIKCTLKNLFLKQHHLTDPKKDDFIRKIVTPKIKAILCTLGGTAYENIIKIVHKKLNINDLFDNRQIYLN